MTAKAATAVTLLVLLTAAGLMTETHVCRVSYSADRAAWARVCTDQSPPRAVTGGAAKPTLRQAVFSGANAGRGADSSAAVPGGGNRPAGSPAMMVRSKSGGGGVALVTFLVLVGLWSLLGVRSQRKSRAA